MENEILNIEYHKKELVLKALQKFPYSREKAARELGISNRTMSRYKNQYNIRYDIKKQEYIIIEKQHKKIAV